MARTGTVHCSNYYNQQSAFPLLGGDAVRRHEMQGILPGGEPLGEP
ncbi:hypothetical protein B0G73_103189 [Paraburkholderia sp. BL25I1N1]|nr:hypothetical protein B0G73_103189 [Paraburkholderia sp. BL25I1N1]